MPTDGDGSRAGAVCVRCGAVADPAPADWTVERGPRGVERLCPACTRAHVRDIESKLPTEWW